MTIRTHFEEAMVLPLPSAAVQTRGVTSSNSTTNLKTRFTQDRVTLEKTALTLRPLLRAIEIRALPYVPPLLPVALPPKPPPPPSLPLLVLSSPPIPVVLFSFLFVNFIQPLLTRRVPAQTLYPRHKHAYTHSPIPPPMIHIITHILGISLGTATIPIFCTSYKKCTSSTD